MSSLLSTLQYLHHGELSFEEIMLYFFFLSSLQNNSVWTNFSETACLETLGRNKTPKLQVSSSRYWFNCRECDCCWTVSQGRNWASFSAGHQQVLCSLRMRFTSLTFKWNFLGKHMSLYLSKTRERVMCLVFFGQIISELKWYFENKVGLWKVILRVWHDQNPFQSRQWGLYNHTHTCPLVLGS